MKLIPTRAGTDYAGEVVLAEVLPHPFSRGDRVAWRITVNTWTRNTPPRTMHVYLAVDAAGQHAASAHAQYARSGYRCPTARPRGREAVAVARQWLFFWHLECPGCRGASECPQHGGPGVRWSLGDYPQEVASDVI